MLRSARQSGRRTIVDHVLSMILFVGMLIEFMAIKAGCRARFSCCLSSASSTWPAALRSASGLLSRVAAFLMSQAGGGGAGA
jgi:hypothetical protein